MISSHRSVNGSSCARKKARRHVLSQAVEHLEERRLLSGMYMGTNLGEPNYYGPGVFADGFDQARPWTSKDPAAGDSDSGYISYAPTDAQGYITKVPFAVPVTGVVPQHAETFMRIYGTGTYKLKVTGAGAIVLKAGSGWLDPTTPNFRGRTYNLTGGSVTIDVPVYASPYNDGKYGSIILLITSSDPNGAGDYLRDIHFVLPGLETTYNTEPFVASYADELSSVSNLRFMDWTRTNNNNMVTWNQQAPADFYTQDGTFGGSLASAIDLANRLNKDPWFCIPAKVDDNWITEAARLIRDALNPSLKAYIEYSNETWNGGFQQTGYVQDRGQALALDPDRWTAGQKFVAMRSAQIWDIFQQEFGSAMSSRVAKVMGTQVSTTVARNRMNYLRDPALNPSGIQADMLAFAPYFGNMGSQLIAEGVADTITVQQILDRAQTEIASTIPTQISDMKTVANDFRVYLIAYEGGQHMVASSNASLTTKFIAANRDPRMYDLYTQYLSTLAAGGVAQFNHYSYISSYSKFGSWGAQEEQDQPLTTAHKARALKEWGAANPPTNVAPIARAATSINVIDSDGNGAETITLDASASTDLEGAVASYQWVLNGSVVGTTAQITKTMAVGSYQFQLTVTDANGAASVGTVTVTVGSQAALSTMVDSNFTGTNPGLNTPWTAVDSLDANVTFSGWTRGAGLFGMTGNNALYFSGHYGSPATTLAQALTNNYYLEATFTPTAGGSLDLRGVSLRAVLNRVGFWAPAKYAVMTSIGGFAADKAIYTSPSLGRNPGDYSFTAVLPATSQYLTSSPVTVRLYAYEGQYSNHTIGLKDFTLGGKWSSTPVASEVILDNTSAGVTVTGAWTSSTFWPGYYGSDYIHDGNTGKGTKSVRYTPTLVASGYYEVFTLATAASNRSTAIPFDINYAGGANTVLVNQQINNSVWVSLGTYAFAAGTSGNVLIRTTGTTGYVVADAIKFVPVTVAPIIQDNTDASGVTITGAWTTSTFVAGYYGANYIHDGNAGKATKSVRYTPTLPASGNYEVLTLSTAGSNRATNIPFDINYAGGTSMVFVNQQINNGAWVSLGTYAFKAGTTGNVLIRTDGTTGYVGADAIKFVPVIPAGTMMVVPAPASLSVTHTSAVSTTISTVGDTSAGSTRSRSADQGAAFHSGRRTVPANARSSTQPSTHAASSGIATDAPRIRSLRGVFSEQLIDRWTLRRTIPAGLLELVD